MSDLPQDPMELGANLIASAAHAHHRLMMMIELEVEEGEIYRVQSQTSLLA